ncbi:SH3 domain-containing protein 1-like [Carica papaya]|uniref:SH3 domain-containing protein 1-like n=1 Tax=Carica papaya TaxID=3649 RepID=UPI000B8CB1C7|nr:SH3 domain-containing protein 1-like [Carica papaya]
MEIGIPSAKLEIFLEERQWMSVLLKQQLAKAQNRMNQYADLHRIKRQFEEKGLVFLTLQPYRQQSLEGRRNYKLSPRFYGPSEVEGKTSLVASWLKLPEQARTYSVSEPLRALVTGAPLEDARHLTHRYDRLRQEVEAQAADILKRRSKTREFDISQESYMKLKNAEARLTEFKSAMMTLGREATAAMLSVEDQQQKITFQRLLAMVDAERTYHQNVLLILERLYSEMIMEEQSKESSLQSVAIRRNVYVPHVQENIKANGSSDSRHINQSDSHFIAKVIHPFDAQADGELSLSVDDYVIVRQVASTGWSEGECKGKAGWFPTAYIEKQEKAPASKLMETG